MSGIEGTRLGAKEIHEYLSRIMYNSRSKMEPLMNHVLIAGMTDSKTPYAAVVIIINISYLGYVDQIGTSFQENVVSTGMGSYMATPLLRKAWHENMSREEAMETVKQAMLVLFYRDARTINRVSKCSPK